eukprot:527361_1
MSALSVLTSLISVFATRTDHITGWTVDRITNRPIDPQTKLPVSKNIYKRLSKKYRREQKKLKRKKVKQQIQQQKLNSAPHINEDLSLPTATYIRIGDGIHYVNVTKRVEIRGYLQNKPKQIRSRVPLILLHLVDEMSSDMDEYAIQCVLEGDICKTKQVIGLTNRSLLTVRGLIVEFKTDHELRVDYLESCDASYFQINHLSSSIGWQQRYQYLIDGYSRDSTWCVTMPVDIGQVMQIFIGDIWNDEWDLDLKNKYIEIEADNVKTRLKSWNTGRLNTVFGTKIIYGWPWCQKYRWKLQMVHSNEYGNRHCFFGVIPAQNVSDQVRDWIVSIKNDGYGYCHRNGYKYYHALFDFGLSKDDEYGPSLKDGDIIEFELDMEHGTLRYYVNGTDLGIAWNALKGKKYRLAVTMGWKGEKIKLFKSV